MPRQQTYSLSLSQLASVYTLSKQAVSDLIRKHGFPIVADPSALWLRLLEVGRAGKLRTLLSDPAFLQSATDQLAAILEKLREHKSNH